MYISHHVFWPASVFGSQDGLVSTPSGTHIGPYDSPDWPRATSFAGPCAALYDIPAFRSTFDGDQPGYSAGRTARSIYIFSVCYSYFVPYEKYGVGWTEYE